MLARIDEDEKQGDRSATLATARNRMEIEQLNARRQRLQDALLEGLLDSEIYAFEKAKIMSRKKTLEEQSAAIVSGSRFWLEPLKKWVLEAQTLSKDLHQRSLFEKRDIAKEIFGSNLVLDGKKARGEAVKPWAILAVNEFSNEWVHVLEVARTHFAREFAKKRPPVSRRLGRAPSIAKSPAVIGL
jgi:hypothetical protein